MLLLSLFSGAATAEEPTETKDSKEKKSLEPSQKLIRQKTRLLRACPKRYAILKAAVASRGEVELVMEGETDPRASGRSTRTRRSRSMVSGVVSRSCEPEIASGHGSGSIERSDPSVSSCSRTNSRRRSRIPEPPADVARAKLPPDIGRARAGAERIDWFLSSTYCGCSIAGDGCTGMFYTLASCNPETCGMPNKIRARVGELVDEGLTDREIFARLEEDRGQLIFTPHLLR